MAIGSPALEQKHSPKWKLAALLIAAAGLLAYSPATAQDNAAANNPPPLTNSPLTGQPINQWSKACDVDPETKRDVCVTSFELRDQRGGFLATVGARRFSEGEPNDLLLITVPPGMLLQPGFRIRIDEQEPIAGIYTICVPARCIGQISGEVTDLVEKMKKGTAITIFTINPRRQTVPFPITLSGFTAAFDGDPVELSELEKNKAELANTLRARAEAARQRLLQQQQQQNQNQ